ncbi:MAG: cytidine/deoxycytidylate deaminase family protein [Desulfobacteraceae bacterium]|nr:cytidine/deoxycytidylate deaminase family protein [Desulfobacteraceae bacterium]
MERDTRPSWDAYFISIARLVSGRSTCLRRKVGAVLVKDRRILSTGYNGAPSGLKHCLEIGCLRDELKVPSGQRHELCRALHAEQNVIVQAAYYGTPVAGSILYCTNLPCIICTKMLINAGILSIYYDEGYADGMSRSMLEEAGVELIQLAGAAKMSSNKD